jgi:signal transduction histidine kinase
VSGSGPLTTGERLLHQISTVLAREEEPVAVVRVALDALVNEVGASIAAVFFVDEETDSIQPVYAVNYPPEVLDRIRGMSTHSPAFSNIALRTGEVQVLTLPDNIPPGSQFTVNLAEEMGIASSVAVPLVSGGRRLGVLVYGLAERRDFSQQDLALLKEVGEHIAVALERSRLLGELERRAREAELIQAIATEAAGEPDLDRILAVTLDRLSGLVSFTGGSIALVEGDDLVIRAVAGPLTEGMRDRRIERGTARTWEVVESREPFVCGDLLAAGYDAPRLADGEPLCSYLAVPLVWRGTAFGILEIDSTRRNAFRSGDLALMRMVATALSGPVELARRYAEEVHLRGELDQAKGQLEAILEHAPMGIFFFDAEHRLAYANSASFTTMRLLPDTEARLGRSWSELVDVLIRTRWDSSPEELQEIVAQTWELREGLLEHDFPLHSPPQMLRRIAAPVVSGGQVYGHVVLLIDITSERNALDEARRAIALRDRFISIASHELKTPLTAVKSASQLLLRSVEAGNPDTDRLTRYLQTVDAQADRLRALIDELLDVSRIRSGKMDLRPEPADFRALATETIATLTPDKRRRVRLHAPMPVHGVWDTARMAQVVLNLVDNALKYSSEAAPVDVRLTGVPGRLTLLVSDRGIGIAKPDLDELFQPFARASNALTHSQGGLGLGLFIIRQIVERHGGTIAITSDIGSGTTFTVALPLHPPPQGP